MRMRIALVTALVFAAPLGAQSASTPWMEGCWAAGRTQESWTRLRDGTLLGAGTVVRDGRRDVTERLRLEARRDRITYIADPIGQRLTRFSAVAADADSLLVANPAHDFPQTIRYHRVGEDTLLVALTGVENGTPRSMGMTFVRRAECAALGEVGVATVPDGSTVRLRLADARITGKLLALGITSVTLRQDDAARDVPFDAILGVERMRRSAGRGALIGGGIGGVAVGGFFYLLLGAICESVTGCRDDQLAGGAFGFLLGGVGGALVGAGVGSLVPRWERVTP